MLAVVGRELVDFAGEGRILGLGHQLDHPFARAHEIGPAAHERAQSLDGLVRQAVPGEHLRLDDERLDLAILGRGGRRRRQPAAAEPPEACDAEAVGRRNGGGRRRGRRLVFDLHLDLDLGSGGRRGLAPPTARAP